MAAEYAARVNALAASVHPAPKLAQVARGLRTPATAVKNMERVASRSIWADRRPCYSWIVIRLLLY